MNYRTILIVAAVIFLSPLSKAYANDAHGMWLDTIPVVGPYATTENSTLAKTTFGWDETPFIYEKWDVNQLNRNAPLYLTWVWRYGQTEFKNISFQTFDLSSPTIGDELEVWGKTTLWSGMPDWKSYRKAGTWYVTAFWFNFENTNIGERISFTVTPEPVSSVLFLLGGAGLAARSWRRFNSKNKLKV